MSRNLGSADARFCHNCGASLGVDLDVGGYGDDDGPVMASTAGGKSGAKIVVGAVAVLVLALVGFNLIRGDGEPSRSRRKS